MYTRARRLLFVHLLATAAMGGVLPASAADPCASPMDFVEVGVVLHSAAPRPQSGFIGEFHVHNVRFGKPIVLAGKQEHSRFFMEYPSALMQFKDLNGQWENELMIPGTFSGQKDRLTIGPGETKSLFIELPSAERVSAGGREFRILLLTWDSHTCIASSPFQALQARGPITGFGSAKRSNKSLERTRER
jgi:hypothetical protein